MNTDSTATSPATPRIPLALKLAYSAFMVVLVPYYFVTYGLTNFLWFCDVALIVTLIGIWRESPFLISTQAVAIVLPQIAWIVSFVVQLVTGEPFIGLAGYMFDPTIPLFVRGLSMFHGWMPLLLIWLVVRVGYHPRSWKAQTVLAAVVLTTSFLVLEGPTGLAGNVNKVFGLDDKTPQTFMHPVVWVALLCAVYPMAIYLPSHLIFSKIMPRCAAD